MTLIDYLLNAALIGLVALQIKGHRVTLVRLAVPVVLTIWGASQFLHAIPLAGNDGALEAALTLLGAALGILAGAATSIVRDGTGAVARARFAAAILWVVGIGARVGFSLWVSHGGQGAVASFSAAAHVTSGAAWAAGFILMAMAEVVARTSVLYLRTVRSGAIVPRGGLRGRVAIS
jgi:hypothetical protein